MGCSASIHANEISENLGKGKKYAENEKDNENNERKGKSKNAIDSHDPNQSFGSFSCFGQSNEVNNKREEKVDSLTQFKTSGLPIEFGFFFFCFQKKVHKNENNAQLNVSTKHIEYLCYLL